MYTSGQFADMFRVTKKLLRHYNEIGLLKPSDTNSLNGYHYYNEYSCERMKRIMYLRSLYFSLEDIQTMMHEPEEAWEDFLHKQLLLVQTDQRVKKQVEEELLDMKKRIDEGKDVFDKERLDISLWTDVDFWLAGEDDENP